MDTNMQALAAALWPSPQQLKEVAGGLFNRVVRVDFATGTGYLKSFTETAVSGNFPPLPTSAAERCLVASAWHRLAMRASADAPQVAVPALLAVQPQCHLLAMEQAQGVPLYAVLQEEVHSAAHVLTTLVSWLGVLHGLPLEPRAPLLAASRPFKAFKVDLQYTRLLPELPQELHAAAEAFVAEYLAQEDEPVHGDINSRNVLVDEDRVAVIDFEQGHYGDGLYDVAYVLSEYTIRDLRLQADPEQCIAWIWQAYCHARKKTLDSVAYRRWRSHLAFQTLYRLVGPSRQVWTGHLSPTEQARVRSWSTAELARWLL